MLPYEFHQAQQTLSEPKLQELYQQEGQEEILKKINQFPIFKPLKIGTPFESFDLNELMWLTHYCLSGGDKPFYIDKNYKYRPILNNVRFNNIETIDAEHIRVANSHEDIKHVLDLCENTHVYSVDHHHDLGYPMPDDVPEEEAHMCTCANWGKVFLDDGTITKFTWINNMNSENPQVFNIADDNRIEVKDLGNTILDELPQMDYLFLCLSPEWVPSQYHPLFFSLLDIINKIKESDSQKAQQFEEKIETYNSSLTKFIKLMILK